MKRIVATGLALVGSAALAQAGLYVNAGFSPAAGIGPAGSNANYVAYNTPHETDASGALQTFTGISFAEGGLGGTYDVGVQFTWPATTANTVKQSFLRTQNPGGAYSPFYQSWVGMDTRTAQGGIGVGTTMRLTLTGLATNTDYTLTSYHFDTHDQTGTFTTSASGATVYTSGRANLVSTIDPSLYQYDFDLTSDGSGTATIDYVSVSGSWIAMNGFDVVAVPEPAALGLIVAVGGGILFVRRRMMM